jgi:hypothetical protein
MREVPITVKTAVWLVFWAVAALAVAYLAYWIKQSAVVFWLIFTAVLFAGTVLELRRRSR